MKKHELKILIERIIKEILQKKSNEVMMGQERNDHRFDTGRTNTMKAVNVEGKDDARVCNCGSGLMSHWENDARGIPLARVCSKCKEKSLGRFRQDVRNNSNYEADEPIEPEEYYEDIQEDDEKLKGKFVNRGEIKLESGLDYKTAEKIANHHWDIFGSAGADERGVFNFKTRGDRWCCSVGILDGKPAMLSITTTPGRLQLLVGNELGMELKEMTGTGAAGGYSTPFAFSKNKLGSTKAIDAAKKYGTVVKSISEKQR